MTYDNITFATASSLERLMRCGKRIDSRVGETLELRDSVLTLNYPTQRCLFLPGRGNDPFAAVAETLWVLAGRSDVAWLERYLPRARNYSDDGRVWRGGYGPRLRSWHGADPLREVIKLLQREPDTRRAVLSLFDPAADYDPKSLDIPCTNWLSFLCRNDHLHLTIGMRSNDVWWGFSGVNAFEWSVLQQMLAKWLDARVGDLTFVATSLHLYKKHWSAATDALQRFRGLTCYQAGFVAPTFSVPWDKFDDTLARVFAIEQKIYNAPGQRRDRIDDDLLDACLDMLELRRAWEIKVGTSRLVELAAKMPDTDLKIAALSWLCRRDDGLLGELPLGTATTFLTNYLSPADDVGTGREFADAIEALHRRKDRAYGNAWKKRGEKMSILPNIARKIDRLLVYASESSELDEETLLDTAVDLFVYVLKYQLFLIDRGAERPMIFTNLSLEAGHFSDCPVAFAAVVRDALAVASTSLDVDEAIKTASAAFENSHCAAQRDADLDERSKLASVLLHDAVNLTVAIASEQTSVTAMFIAQERQRVKG